MRDRAFTVVRPNPLGAQYINQNKQSQPNDVDKVPIPSGRFESETIRLGEMALHGPTQHNHEHDGTDGDMSTVKTGQHKEGRSKDA